MSESIHIETKVFFGCNGCENRRSIGSNSGALEMLGCVDISQVPVSVIEQIEAVNPTFTVKISNTTRKSVPECPDDKSQCFRKDAIDKAVSDASRNIMNLGISSAVTWSYSNNRVIREG